MIVNKVIEAGKLAEYPRTVMTAKGAVRTSFRLAVPTGQKGADGEDTAYYFEVVTWRKLAEACAKELRQGDTALVVGKLTARSYTAEDGSVRGVTEIEAEQVEKLRGGNQHHD